MAVVEYEWNGLTVQVEYDPATKDEPDELLGVSIPSLPVDASYAIVEGCDLWEWAWDKLQGDDER